MSEGNFAHELVCKDDVDLKIMDDAGLQYGVVSTSDGNENIFVTTSGIFDEMVVKYATEKIGVDHIMFGADFPYENCKRSVDFILIIFK